MKQIQIRTYISTSDRETVLNFIDQLQEFERTLDLKKKPGREIASDYLDYLIKKCRTNDGVILIAVVENRAGFSCVWIEKEDDPSEDGEMTGYISDLYIASDYRNKGIASMLFIAMKKYAQTKGVRRIRLNTLYQNKDIQNLLTKLGAKPYEISWEIKV